MDVDAAIALLNRESIYKLSGTDGCLCMHCAIQGIEIDISCRKSTGSGSVPWDDGFRGTVVRVHSKHLDATLTDLDRVAQVVVTQIMPDASKIVVRLCDFETDRKMLCAWCGEPRTDPKGYYCEKHQGVR